MAKCPIWDVEASVSDRGSDSLKVTSDRAGGSYEITGTAAAVAPTLSPQEKGRLTTWLVDQRNIGVERPIIDSAIIKLIRTRPPLRVGERLDRVLLWRERSQDKVGRSFRYGGQQNEETRSNKQILCAWTESEKASEVSWLLQQLTDQKLLEAKEGDYSVSLEGWLRLEQLRNASVISSQAFVAMWFNEKTNDAYANGIEPAIADCGYVAMRIDRKEHSNKIDDEIIAEIRRSRFLVADFTSERDRPRGGVYFEAGFAMGLNIPVIWTCHRDLLDQVHFDTRQFNHIDWSDPVELRRRLRNRVAAVIGDGPNRLR